MLDSVRAGIKTLYLAMMADGFDENDSAPLVDHLAEVLDRFAETYSESLEARWARLRRARGQKKKGRARKQ